MFVRKAEDSAYKLIFSKEQSSPLDELSDKTIKIAQHFLNLSELVKDRTNLNFPVKEVESVLDALSSLRALNINLKVPFDAIKFLEEKSSKEYFEELEKQNSNLKKIVEDKILSYKFFKENL